MSCSIRTVVSASARASSWLVARAGLGAVGGDGVGHLVSSENSEIEDVGRGLIGVCDYRAAVMMWQI